MARPRSLATVRWRLPGYRDLRRFVMLVLLLLAAMGSTQLLPHALAQDAVKDAGQDVGDPAPPPLAASNEPSDRSQSVFSDQAMPSDRTLQVPAASNNRSDTGRQIGAIQVPSRTGKPSVPAQLTPVGGDRGQLAPQRLKGSDVCDDVPADAGPDVCANPLEARAGEFAGARQPQLSAEQRLLAQQFSSATNSNETDGTARRLASGRNVELSTEDLAIAAIVTADQSSREPSSKEDGTDIPADATNAINVILGVINAPPPE